MQPVHTTERQLIHGLTRDELTALVQELGEPSYRASQLWQWLYVRRITDWANMRNIPTALREQLAERFSLACARYAGSTGEEGGTRKILVRLPDGEQVEEVLIPAQARRTVCLSCQVGCRFHCAFCASGQAGFRRDLLTGEMVGQVLLAAGIDGKPPSHVVFMGIGEPFDNYDRVLKTVRILNDKEGLSIGVRRLTISTCGIVPGIERLATEGLQVELSVSLHAPSDDLRSELMPVNRKYPLSSLLKACAAYTAATKRIVTFEYTLIRDVNDTPRHAAALAQLLAPLPCRVNLIPLSPIPEFAAGAASTAGRRFIQALGRAGLNATLRASEGSSLKAACGQLRYGRHGS